MRIKSFVILLGVFIFVILIGCAKQSVPKQEVISVNIVEWEKSGVELAEPSDKNCKENPQVWQAYCLERQDLTINLAVNNYKGEKIDCRVRDSFQNGWYNPIESNMGVNKFKAALIRDIRQDTEFTVCCFNAFGDGSDEKCVTEIIPPNNAFK